MRFLPFAPHPERSHPVFVVDAARLWFLRLAPSPPLAYTRLLRDLPWRLVTVVTPRKVSMSSYRHPSTGATFRQFLDGFVQSDRLPFRDVLTAEQIEQA